MEHRGLIFQLIAAFAILFTDVVPAVGAECLPDTREVSFPNGSSRLRTYICKRTTTTKAELRIEFDRLSEPVAGGLLKGSLYPELDQLLGTTKVLDNAVKTQAMKLFDSFGKKRTFAYYLGSLEVTAAAGLGTRHREGTTAEEWTHWSLFPYHHTFEKTPPNINVLLHQPLQTVINTITWPLGFNFFYEKCDLRTHKQADDWGEQLGKNPIPCTILWKGVTDTEFDTFTAGAMAANSYSVEREEEISRYISLLRHIKSSGWKDDFLTIEGEFLGGCLQFGFTAYGRKLILDIARIENISDKPLSLDGLLGKITEGGLREVEQNSQVGDRVALSTQPVDVMLLPGEVFAVPLRISFAAQDEDLFRDKRAANETYTNIRSMPAGTMFKFGPNVTINGSDVILQKARESFSAPTAPSSPSYVYGPQLDLKGILVNNEQILFAGAARNFIRLDVDDMKGSCPYLYAWNEKLSHWVDYGRIIHTANSKNRKATQRLSLNGFVSKLRIAEEEQETSYIDRVRGEVEMANGTLIPLSVKGKSLEKDDVKISVIGAGETLEVEFLLPEHTNRESVKRTIVEVTGYYEPNVTGVFNK